MAESDPYDEDALDVTWDETDQTFKAGTTVIPTKLSEYDDDGRLTAVILAAVVHPDTTTSVRPRYEYTYDERGNLLTIRDNVVHDSAGVGDYDHDGITGDDTRVTEFTYDAQGRQTSRTLPLGVATPGDDTDFVEKTEYDDLGRVTYQVSFEGVVTAYVYDDADGIIAGESGRLVVKHYYGGGTAEADYLTDVADGTLTASDETVTYTYDAFGRQIGVTQDLTAGTRVTENVYDTFGRLITVKADVDGDETFEQQINYEYDPVTGQIQRTYTGDADPTQSSTASDGSEFAYDVRADGKRTGVTEKVNDGTSTKETRVDWLYDNIGRLTGEAYDADMSVDGDALDFIARYDFDLVGNRLGKQTDQAATDAGHLG